MPQKQSLYTLPRGHRLLAISTGKTATFRTNSSHDDSGCSFCLFIPSTHPLSRRARGTSHSTTSHDAPSSLHSLRSLSDDASEEEHCLTFPLLVLAHSSRNNGQTLRDEWSDWAEKHQVMLLSIVLPYRIVAGQIDESWKSMVSRLDGQGLIRYDREIMDMVDMVQQDWGAVNTERFGLAGFSGGAQFAQRFWLLHPDRISVVSLAAPGAITRLARAPWPDGVDDTLTLFGVPVTAERLRTAKTVVHCLIGSRDIPARHTVMARLMEELDLTGVRYSEGAVHGAGHEEGPIRDAQQAFFAMHLAARTWL